MKKFLALLISLSMLIMCVPGISLVASADELTKEQLVEKVLATGDGSEADPYEISSGAEFAAIYDNAYVGVTNEIGHGKVGSWQGKWFALTQSITLPDGYFPPDVEGADHMGIKSNFDGGSDHGYTITYNIGTQDARVNLNSKGFTSYFGLFHRNYGEIKNVKTIGDWYLEAGTSDIKLGGIVGRQEGSKISNCTNGINININPNGNTDGIRAAGIMGIVNGASATYRNLINEGNVYGGQNLAGIAVDITKTNITFEGCKNYGYIKGSSPIGGILAGLGGYSPVTFNNCANYGIIESGKAGGILGCMQSGTAWTVTMTNCINAGDIVSNSGSELSGALIGSAFYFKDGQSGNLTLTVKDCYNVGRLVYRGSSADSAGRRGDYWGSVGGGVSGATGKSYTATGTVTIDNYYDIGSKNDIFKPMKYVADASGINISGLIINIGDAYTLNADVIGKDIKSVTGGFLKSVPSTFIEDEETAWEAPSGDYPYIQLKTNKIENEKVTQAVRTKEGSGYLPTSNRVPVVENTSVTVVRGDAISNSKVSAEDAEKLANVKDKDGNVTPIAEGTSYAFVVARIPAMVGEYEYGIVAKGYEEDVSINASNAEKIIPAVRKWDNGTYAVLVYNAAPGTYSYRPYVRVNGTYYYGAQSTFIIAE